MEGLRMHKLAIVLAALSSVSAQDPVPGKPKDEPKPAAKVVLRLKCSDVILETAMQVGKEYGKTNPKAEVAVVGGGSGAALAGLANGSVDVAITTRQTTPEELAAIRAKGFEPMEQVIGYEDLAIVVHKDNPIESLTVTQLADMWREKGATTQWSQLGVTLPDGKDAAVRLVGRQQNTGTYLFFKSAVLGPRDLFRLGTIDMNGTKDVVDQVANTPNAIGYCAPAYVVGNVKMVPIAAKAGSKPMLATAEDASYPLRRAIYAYFHDEPTGNVKAFAIWLRKAEAVKAAGLTPR